jgi:hypothetical protein
MKKLTVLITALLYTAIAYSQNTFRATIKDAKTNLPLIGATALLQGSGKGASSDTAGLVTITNIPSGKQVIVFRYVGYQTLTDTLDFPVAQTEPRLILLSPEGKGDGEELEEVVVSATRSSRTIANIPTRVEVISGEELDEKRQHETRRYPHGTGRKYGHTNPANIGHQRQLQHPDPGVGWQIHPDHPRRLPAILRLFGRLRPAAGCPA